MNGSEASAHIVLLIYDMIRRMAVVSVVMAFGFMNAVAATYLYDKAFESHPLPTGSNPWMTLKVSGNVLTVTVPDTTVSRLDNVYLTVSDPAVLKVNGDARPGTGIAPDKYNLALAFDGVGHGTYQVKLEGWDGILSEPKGGFCSIASFTDGTWVADSIGPPEPVPDTGSTLIMLGLGLLGLCVLQRVRR